MKKYFYNTKAHKLVILDDGVCISSNLFEITQEQFLSIHHAVTKGNRYHVVDGELVYDDVSTQQHKANKIRSIRNNLLASSDWTIGLDSPLSSDKKNEWIQYRHLLRELPSLDGFPNIEFPQKPQ